MIKQFYRYLFPKIYAQQKLPLLPLSWSSSHSRYGTIPADLGDDVAYIKGHAVARTDHDALTLLRQNPGKQAREIVKEYQRKRRRESRLKRAWRRFKRLWY